MEKLKEIINIIKENRGVEKINDFNTNMKLRDDIGFDSFDLAELTVHIEAEFDVDVFEKGIISTIGEIIEILEKNNV